MTWGRPYRVTTDGRDVTLLQTGTDDACAFAVDPAGALLVLPDDGPKFTAACVERELHPARDDASRLDLDLVREWAEAGVAQDGERGVAPSDGEAGRDQLPEPLLLAAGPFFAGLTGAVGQAMPDRPPSSIQASPQTLTGGTKPIDLEVIHDGLAMWRAALAGSAWVSEATPVLRTPRMTLRPYSLGHEEAFVALFGDPRVTRWVGDGPEPEEADRRLFGRVFTVVYAQHRFDVWGVWHEGQLIGHAEIKPTEVSSGHELVYILAAEVWRRGLGTELAAAVTEYGFTELDLGAVHATVAAENTGSLALLNRLGYRRVRRITEDTGGVTVLLTLDKDSWQKGPGAREALIDRGTACGAQLG